MLRKAILLLVCFSLFTSIIGCVGRKTTESEEPFGEHLAFDFGELETSDSDNDGYTDRFTYTFEKEEVAEDLFMQRTVEYEETEAGFMGELTLEFENTGNETKTYSHVEIIPKSFAESVDDLEFSIPPDEIISPDAIVRWETEVIRDTIEKIIVRVKRAVEVGKKKGTEAAEPSAEEAKKFAKEAGKEFVKVVKGEQVDWAAALLGLGCAGAKGYEALTKGKEVGVKAGMEEAVDAVFGSLDDFAFINALNKCGQQKDSKVKDKCVLQLLARFRDNFKEWIISDGTPNFCADVIINDDYLMPCAVLAEDDIRLCDNVKDEEARTRCKWEFITAKCCASCNGITLEECAINKIVELGDDSLCKRFQDEDVREFCLELFGKGKCSQISIEPSQVDLEPEEECLFTVKCEDGVFRENTWHVWDFGDKTKQVQCRDHTYTHSYEKAGQYTIRVTLEEKEEQRAYGDFIASTTAIVNVQKKETRLTSEDCTKLKSAFQSHLPGFEFEDDDWKCGKLNFASLDTYGEYDTYLDLDGRKVPGKLRLCRIQVYIVVWETETAAENQWESKLDTYWSPEETAEFKLDRPDSGYREVRENMAISQCANPPLSGEYRDGFVVGRDTLVGWATWLWVLHSNYTIEVNIIKAPSKEKSTELANSALEAARSCLGE